MLDSDVMSLGPDFDRILKSPTNGYGKLSRARGYLDILEQKGGQIRVAGWLVHPLHPLQSARIYIDNDVFWEGPLNVRNDLPEALPPVEHAALAGFDRTGQWTAALGKIAKITVIGVGASGDEAIFETYQTTTPSEYPLPPGHLMKRVSGSEDPATFRYLGVDGAAGILARLAMHRDLTTVRTMLDWGCGSGRLSANIVRLLPSVALTGCDIDAEAVAWNNSNIPQANFVAIDPYPPTPFPEASFDVVFGSSVMTHLTRQDQLLWLDEVHRILRPDGLFLPSVHGEFAASFFTGGKEWLHKVLITDEAIDHTLDGIAPPDYYRGTFQLESFTRENWSEKFRILDYVEGGLCSFQDLVVMSPI